MDGTHLELLRASQEIPAHQPASHLDAPGAQNAQPVGGFKPFQTYSKSMDSLPSQFGKLEI